MSRSLRLCFDRMAALAGLFRPDAAAISFLSYLVGVMLTGRRLEASDFLMAALITLISTNFIYSYNCLTDRHEDAVGHPERPLPSGRLHPSAAGIYCLFLLFAAIIYPFFVAASPVGLGLLLLLPILGILYSAPPLRLRRFPVPAILIICTGLVIPLTLGLLRGEPLRQTWPITAGVFLFCLAAVPLKSMEEVEEAHQTGRTNVYLSIGRGLFFYSAIGLVLSGAWAFLMLPGPMRIYLELVSGLSLVLLGYSTLRRRTAGLYRNIIRLIILTGIGLALISL